ncbi:hypothetical protein MKEN_00116700 [Mycena kentingensis (nom. inval.)]|nr:hypothetical protein MKEN_00116700 [Mycena kentingensis (nom. inval.)]
MPRLNARQRAAKVLNQRRADSSTATNIDENTQPSSPAHPQSPRPRRSTIRTRISEQQTQIAVLQSANASLAEELDGLHTTYTEMEEVVSGFRDRIEGLSADLKSERAKKRKAEVVLEAEIVLKEEHADTTHAFDETISDQTNRIHKLEKELGAARDNLELFTKLILGHQTKDAAQQAEAQNLRKRLAAAQRRATRVQEDVRRLRREKKDLAVWRPMEGGAYKEEWRMLGRAMLRAGCAAGRVRPLVRAFAKTVGARVRGKIPSERTILRFVAEGGKYGDVQEAREIINAPGFTTASDGTGHRGITVETRARTLLVPSYAPGVDDSDKSTWSVRTRFSELAPAIDHTAITQHRGEMERAARIADIYNRSPLSDADSNSLSVDEYYKKKMGENRDHASDGKKVFALSAAHKEDIVIRELGRKGIADGSAERGDVLLTLFDISEKDVLKSRSMTEIELKQVTADERKRLFQDTLERRIGDAIFAKLSSSEQSNLTTRVFGGCCAHKDLNVLRIAYSALNVIYAEQKLTRPITLANKTADTFSKLTPEQIRASGPALQKALDSLPSGAIKLLQLMAALLKHRDGERGYQQRAALYVKEQKMLLFDLDESGEFQEVSANRYSTFTYAAADVLVFHRIYHELIEEIIDGKTNSGMANHVEQNVLKGMNCPQTLTELAVLALYGASIGWGYMATIRGGTKDKPMNMLSLTDFHRRIPGFCRRIAANPAMLWTSDTPLDQLTIDGVPFRNQLLIPTLLQLLPDLPNLEKFVSAFFNAAAEGWEHFMPEFLAGGTFDQLTEEQRLILFLLASNCVSEGRLGDYRNWKKWHANGDAETFSAQRRLETNNTEAFIEKYCATTAMRKFVRAEVRKDGASKRRSRFRREWLGFQHSKAQNGIARRQARAARKSANAAKLATIRLELDIERIDAMTSPLLKEQLYLYKEVIKDEEIAPMLWKDMSTVDICRELVSEARLRELLMRQWRKVKGIPPPAWELALSTEDAPADEQDEEDAGVDGWVDDESEE